MIDKPYERYTEESLYKEIDQDTEQDYSIFSYNDNLTSKLGGNFSKIIEFYDSRL